MNDIFKRALTAFIVTLYVTPVVMPGAHPREKDDNEAWRSDNPGMTGWRDTLMDAFRACVMTMYSMILHNIIEMVWDRFLTNQ